MSWEYGEMGRNSSHKLTTERLADKRQAT